MWKAKQLAKEVPKYFNSSLTYTNTNQTYYYMSYIILPENAKHKTDDHLNWNLFYPTLFMRLVADSYTCTLRLNWLIEHVKMCKDPCKYQVTDLSHLDNQALQTIILHTCSICTSVSSWCFSLLKLSVCVMFLRQLDTHFNASIKVSIPFGSWKLVNCMHVHIYTFSEEQVVQRLL